MRLSLRRRYHAAMIAWPLPGFPSIVLAGEVSRFFLFAIVPLMLGLALYAMLLKC